MGSLAMMRTSASHIAPAGGGETASRRTARAGFQTRPAGNAVNLEDEMLKVSANQMDYAAATSLYSRSLGLLKTAIGKALTTKENDDHGRRWRGFRPFDEHRDLGPARAGRADAGDLGKYRQRGFHRADRRAAIPTAARCRPFPPRSTARWTPRS